MGKWLFGLLCAVLVLAHVAAPGFLEIAFWLSVKAFLCPHFNILSSYCGPITAGFVVLRTAQVLFIGALIWVMWELLTTLFFKQEI